MRNPVDQVVQAILYAFVALLAAAAVLALFGVGARGAEPCVCGAACQCTPGNCTCNSYRCLCSPHRVVSAFHQRQCNGVSCTLVKYEWVQLAGHPRQHLLFREGVQIGGWDYDRCVWMDYSPAGWGAPRSQAPFLVPGVESTPAPPSPRNEREYGQLPMDDPRNMGIDMSELRKERVKGPQYCREDGRCISREQALRDVGDGVPDDADCLRLTWVGPEADGERIRRDLEDAAPLAEWRGKVIVQCYPSAAEPILKGRGLGDGLHVQAPDGRRLGVETTYAGPEALAEGLRNAERLRRDPNHRPPQWPALRPGPLQWARDLSSLTDWLKRHGGQILVGVVVLLIGRGIYRANHKAPA